MASVQYLVHPMEGDARRYRGLQAHDGPRRRARGEAHLRQELESWADGGDAECGQ